jgi:formylglycine-generating enzyme required for sulfatase activity
LGAGAFGEVWEAQGPGGFKVALKFVPLGEQAGSIELRSLDVIRNIRHAHLLSIFGAWQSQGMLIIAMELADGTLLQRLEEARAQGMPGIPRDELLEYMREAAKGIDYLNERHSTPDGQHVGIQHKDVKPGNLLLVGRTVKVADFGLAKVLEQTMATVSGGMTVAYAAPEFFSEHATRWSDQYSLAASYCELRGGKLPFRGSPTQVMSGHVQMAPDLTMLPQAERPAVARAMAKKPERRWPNCRAFVEALTAPDLPPFRDADADYGSEQSVEPVPPDSIKVPPPRLKLRSAILAGAMAVVGLGLLTILWVLLTRPPVATKTYGKGTGPRPQPEAGGPPASYLSGRAETSSKPSQKREERKEGTAAKTADSKPSGIKRLNPLDTPPREPAAPAKDAGDILVLNLGEEVKIELVKIKAGTFLMGSPESDKEAYRDEKPQHEVSLTQDYYLGKYPVTQQQYEKIMGSNPSCFSAGNDGKDKVAGTDTRRFPVENVSWNDAQEFCSKLSRLTGRACCLPTEVEWEYACRAGSPTRYSFWDEDQLEDYAWHVFNSHNRTHEVGTKRPNGWGLYDMHGNIWQWCADWYGKDYYANSPKVDPQGPNAGEERVLRGGCWLHPPRSCRSACRGMDGPSFRNSHIGFRVVLRLD